MNKLLLMHLLTLLLIDTNTVNQNGSRLKICHIRMFNNHEQLKV